LDTFSKESGFHEKEAAADDVHCVCETRPAAAEEQDMSVGTGVVVRGLEWELEGDKAGTMVKVKTRKEGENYHDRHAVLYLGFTLTVLGQHGGDNTATDHSKQQTPVK